MKSWLFPGVIPYKDPYKEKYAYSLVTLSFGKKNYNTLFRTLFFYPSIF